MIVLWRRVLGDLGKRACADTVGGEADPVNEPIIGKGTMGMTGRGLGPCRGMRASPPHGILSP